MSDFSPNTPPAERGPINGMFSLAYSSIPPKLLQAQDLSADDPAWREVFHTMLSGRSYHYLKAAALALSDAEKPLSQKTAGLLILQALNPGNLEDLRSACAGALKNPSKEHLMDAIPIIFRVPAPTETRDLLPPELAVKLIDHLAGKNVLGGARALAEYDSAFRQATWLPLPTKNPINPDMIERVGELMLRSNSVRMQEAGASALRYGDRKSLEALIARFEEPGTSFSVRIACLDSLRCRFGARGQGHDAYRDALKQTIDSEGFFSSNQERQRAHIALGIAMPELAKKMQVHDQAFSALMSKIESGRLPAHAVWREAEKDGGARCGRTARRVANIVDSDDISDELKIKIIESAPDSALTRSGRLYSVLMRLLQQEDLDSVVESAIRSRLAPKEEDL